MEDRYNILRRYCYSIVFFASHDELHRNAFLCLLLEQRPSIRVFIPQKMNQSIILHSHYYFLVGISIYFLFDGRTWQMTKMRCAHDKATPIVIIVITHLKKEHTKADA